MYVPKWLVYKTKPACIVLAHELVHVIRRMTGIPIDNKSMTNYYLGGPEPDQKLLRKAVPEELETTGIDYVNVLYDVWSNAKTIKASEFYYSENSIRLEYDRFHKNDIGYVKLGRRASF